MVSFKLEIFYQQQVRQSISEIHTFLKKLFTDYPSIVKIWLGPELYVSTTEPEYIKLVLTRFLDKGNYYHLMTGYFQRALAAAPGQ